MAYPSVSARTLADARADRRASARIGGSGYWSVVGDRAKRALQGPFKLGDHYPILENM